MVSVQRKVICKLSPREDWRMNSSISGNMTNMTMAKTDTTFLQFAYVVDVYIETTICALGIVGNSLVVYVLQKDNLYPGIRLLYQLLGAVDMTYLTTCLVFKVLNMIQYWTTVISRVTWSHLDLYFSPFLSITQGLADWHVVLVSLGTYWTVCKTYWAKRHLNLHNVWILSVALWILSLMYHIPMFLEFRVSVYEKIHTIQNGSTNVSVRQAYLIREPILNRYKIYNTVYHICGFIAFRFVLPLSLLIFANIAVIREIHHLDAVRKNRSSFLLRENSNGGDSNGGGDRRSPRKYAHLLKVVVAVYLLCTVPHFALRIIFLCVPKGVIRLWTMNNQSNVLSYLSVFTSLMYKVKSCCYIIIFSLLRQNFRHLMYPNCTCKPS